MTSAAPSELVTRRPSLVTSPSSFVISSGMGGVGKTQLAVEFAYRYGRFFHGVHWVSAENPDAIDTAVAECGRRMNLHPTFGDLPLADQVALTERAWAGPEARLIIFDNCEKVETLAGRRPKGGGARLLITSRNAVWPVEYGAATLPVQPLPRPESQALLRRYLAPAGREESDAALDRVAHTVGDLPLALALAGHYLARHRRVTVDDYLDRVDRADDLLPIGRGAINLTGHELSLRRTFAVSYDDLDAAGPVDEAAVALLARAARFAPGEPLPESLLEASAESLTGDDAADPTLFDDALLRLLELGLLERAGTANLRLHRLIGRFVEGAVAAEVMDGAREGVERAVIDLAYEQNEGGDPRRLREWETHLRHVVDVAKEREDETAATLCGNLGYYLQMSGELAAARPYYERALAIYERVLGPEHPDTALSLNNMGFLLQSMGELAAARPYFERALAIRERVLGPEHPDTARSLNNMGSLLQAMGELAAARPYFERALAIRERVLGPEHPDTAASLNNIAILYYYEGDFQRAADHMSRALAILEKALGPNHPNTISSRNSLLVIEARLRDA